LYFILWNVAMDFVCAESLLRPSAETLDGEPDRRKGSAIREEPRKSGQTSMFWEGYGPPFKYVQRAMPLHVSDCSAIWISLVTDAVITVSA
jgi:hypothetical protein